MYETKGKPEAEEPHPSLSQILVGIIVHVVLRRASEDLTSALLGPLFSRSVLFIFMLCGDYSRELTIVLVSARTAAVRIPMGVGTFSATDCAFTATLGAVRSHGRPAALSACTGVIICMWYGGKHRAVRSRGRPPAALSACTGVIICMWYGGKRRAHDTFTFIPLLACDGTKFNISPGILSPKGISTHWHSSAWEFALRF